MPPRGSSPPIRQRLAKSLENRALVYFSGITLAILDDAARETLLAAVAKARRSGLADRLRPQLPAAPLDRRARTRKQRSLEALAVTDIALPTFPDEQMLFGDADAAGDRRAAWRSWRRRDRRQERRGAGAGRCKRRDRRVPAVHVAAPVDTTGAGDSFNGAYLAARLAGHRAGRCGASARIASPPPSSRCAARWRRSRRCEAASAFE